MCGSYLFGKGTTETLKKLAEDVFLSVFEGVPQSEVSKSEIEDGIGIIGFLVEKTAIFKSNGEARRMLKDNGVSINKAKVKDNFIVGTKDLLTHIACKKPKNKKNRLITHVFINNSKMGYLYLAQIQAFVILVILAGKM